MLVSALESEFILFPGSKRLWNYGDLVTRGFINIGLHLQRQSDQISCLPYSSVKFLQFLQLETKALILQMHGYWTQD